MPYLAREQVTSLLHDASKSSQDDMLCIALNGFAACGSRTARDYCRTCDEFYWLHLPGCFLYDGKHNGHRLTIVPFVEER